MTDQKTPAEDPEIIEGVAVEKTGAASSSAAGAGKRRASDGTGAARKAAGKKAAGKKVAGAPDPESSGPESSEAGSPGPAEPADNSTAANPRRPAGGISLPGLIAVAAMLVAGAGLGVQEWRAAARFTAVQADVAALAARLEVAEAGAGAARQEASRLSGQMSDRLAGLEAAMPDDPQAVISELAAVQTDLARRLDALESEPASGANVTASSAMVLAQSGLTVASAMLADSLAGGDPARWLDVLAELRDAGLPLDGLAALRGALSPPPPSPSQLLAEAEAMLPLFRATARRRAGGWWSSTADRLAGFVTLRRQAEGDEPAEPDSASPLAIFAAAIGRGQLAAALDESARLASTLPDHAAEINAWRIAAGRRLAADEALAAFSAAMAALLAQPGTAGKAE